METIVSREIRKKQLSGRQQDIVVGSLLGDGYLVQTTNGYAFRVNHGLRQKTYVDWKYNELKDLTNSKPRQSQNCYYFRTVTHPYFISIRKRFYYNNIKRLPSELIEWMNPLAFTVWLMDDGSKDGDQLRLNTQSFSLEENEKLIDLLKAKFGIMASLNRDKDRFRLRVKANSMSIVRQIVVPYIIPNMRYKLSL